MVPADHLPRWRIHTAVDAPVVRGTGYDADHLDRPWASLSLRARLHCTRAETHATTAAVARVVMMPLYMPLYMPLNSLHPQVSTLVNSDTCPRPTAHHFVRVRERPQPAVELLQRESCQVGPKCARWPTHSGAGAARKGCGWPKLLGQPGASLTSRRAAVRQGETRFSSLAGAGPVITYKYPLNALKDTYDYSCY